MINNNNSSNKRIILKALPKGKISKDLFEITTSQLIPILQQNEVLCKVLVLSIDPALFGRLRKDDNYVTPAIVGNTMPCYGIAQVIESKNKHISSGDLIFGLVGMQEYSVLPAKELRKINPHLYPYSLNLSTFGLAGITAYFGLTDILKIKKGETIVISAAVGSVGSIASQIAHIKGCRTIAITSTEEKVKYATQHLGYDAALSYNSKNFLNDLQKACPNGIDAYFDNIGGDVPNYLLPLYNTHAQIALCGRMALQHLDSEYQDVGIRDHTTLIRKRIKKQGFVIIDYYKRFPEAITQLLDWHKKGMIKIVENYSYGIESAPDALIGILEGKNIGKQLVKISEPTLPFNKSGKWTAYILKNKLFPTQIIATLLRKSAKK